MRRISFKLFSVLALSAMTMFSCGENGDGNDDVTPNSSSSVGRVYILNEGVWGGNDAELSRYSPEEKTITNDYFSNKNGRGLGDVGNDIEVYGGKVYVVMNTSNTLEVIDKNTGMSVKQVLLTGKQPREVAFYEGYAYVSCYDKSVVKIDTATLNIVAECQIEGGKCEDLCAIDGYLYVANAWSQTGTGSMIYDSVLTVINLSTFQVEKTITIGLNPKTVVPIGEGRIMVSCNGNYADIPSSLSILDVATEQVEKLDIEVSNFAVYNNEYAIVYSYSWTSGQQVYTKLNLSTFVTTSWSSADQVLVSPYGIAIDPKTQNVYITDAQNYQTNGDVYVFDAKGVSMLDKHECGIGPSKIVFL